jgi:DNA-binding NarL/FixJ family response regulator
MKDEFKRLTMGGMINPRRDGNETSKRIKNMDDKPSMNRIAIMCLNSLHYDISNDVFRAFTSGLLGNILTKATQTVIEYILNKYIKDINVITVDIPNILKNKNKEEAKEISKQLAAWMLEKEAVYSVKIKEERNDESKNL